MRVTLLLLAAVATVADARPTAQTLTCPPDADSCDLEIDGKLTYSKRDRLAKWDNLRIATKGTVIYASINIPHRTRLKLKAGKRYRFKIGTRKPFGATDLWVIDAR